MPRLPQELTGVGPGTGPEPDSGAASDPTPCIGLDRRQFLRLSAGGLATLALFPARTLAGRAPGGRFALSGRPLDPAADDDRIPLVWLETGVCTGCGCALLASPAPPAESLLPGLRLEFQETLMEEFGAAAVERLLAAAQAQPGSFVLIVDGAIPVGEARTWTMVGEGGDGIERSAEEILAQLAPRAAQVVALGTCACFGGIPGSAPNTGRYGSVADVIGRTPVRLPGCPPHPAWIASALTALLRGDEIALDALGRPLAFYGPTVHDRCPRREAFERGDFADAPGELERCFFKVGCKGPMAHGDCSSSMWHGRSSCIKANHPCIGCTAPGFLDARPVLDGRPAGPEGRAATPFATELEGWL